MRLDQLTSDYKPQRHRNPVLAVATFQDDGIIKVEWRNNTWEFESEDRYNQFLDENDLIGSPTDIRVLEVHFANSEKQATPNT